MLTLVKPVIRCSGLDRLLTCHGSRVLEDKMNHALMDFGDEDGDAMTWRGLWCHHESAKILVKSHGAIAPQGLSQPVLPVGYTPSPWDDRTVAWFVQCVTGDTPPDHAIFVERRFEVEFEHFILSGQLDVYSINADATEFTIDDHKTGPNEVDHAEANWQLTGYATLLKMAYPTLKKGKLRIRQKYAEVPTTQVECDEMDFLVRYVETSVNAALWRSRDLETGYRQCRLCPCIEFCPALEAEITAMKITLTEDEVEALVVTPNLKLLAQVAARGRAIEGPIKRLLATLKARVAAEGPVVLDDGSTVRVLDGEGRRTVNRPEVAYDFAIAKLQQLLAARFPDGGAHDAAAHDAAWSALTLSLVDLEDELVAAGMPRKSKDESVETAQTWIKRSLGHLITRPPTKVLKFS